MTEPTILRFRRRAAGDTGIDTATKALQNLLSHIPAEASTLYVAGLDIVGQNANAGTLIAVAVFSLLVLLLVRIWFRAQWWVIITSVVAFVLWIYGMGNGPFQALGLNLPQGLGAFFILGFHMVVTIFTTARRQ